MWGAIPILPFSLRRCRWCLCVLVLIAAGGPACRDTEPPPAHNRDLGSDGVSLLPTASVRHDPEVAKGQAEWHPFREFAPEEQAADAGLPEAPGESKPAASDSQGNEQIEAQVREMIDDYNDFVAEATVGELLDYYVADQHLTLKPVFEAVKTFAEFYVAIREELKAKLPDAGARVEAALATLETTVAVRLSVESITVVSDTEATGTVPRGWIARTCRFRLVDEDWYIEIPELAELTELKPGLDAGLAIHRGWLQALQSGRIAPETVLQQVETAAQLAQAQLGLDEEAEINAATETDGE